MGDHRSPLETHAGALIRLLADAAVYTGDLLASRRFVLTGLAAVLDADVWVWAHARIPGRGRPPVILPVLDGGWHNLEQKAHWIQAVLDPDPQGIGSIIARRLLDRAEPTAQATCARQDLISDAEFYASAFWLQRFRHTGLDQWLSTIMVLPDLGMTSDIYLLRRAGKPAYTPEERAMVHAFAGAIEALHRAGLDPPPSTWLDYEALPGRPREVVALLLTGATERQTAALLGLSAHTVHDYVKAIHTHFKVQSRGELLARFRPGAVARGMIK